MISYALMEFEPLAGYDEHLAFGTKTGRWIWTGLSFDTLVEARNRLADEQFARPNAQFKIRPLSENE